MILLKKIRKMFLIVLLTLSTSVVLAFPPEEAAQHGGVYTSYSTYTKIGPIMVLTITTVCNDGTIYNDSDWWWD